MAGFDVGKWLQAMLEKELVVPAQARGDKPEVKMLRARDVFLTDVRILPASPLQREQDPHLRATVSLRLLTPILDGEGKVSAYEVSPVAFRDIQIRERASDPSVLYVRYPSISEISYYEQVTRTNARGETYITTRPVRVFTQGYALTRRQEEFLLMAYRFLRDKNGWDKIDVEAVPAKA